MKKVSLLILVLLLFGTTSKVSSQNYKKPVFDAKTRLAWHQQHLEMQKNTPHGKLKWRHIGPLLMSGRVTDLAVPHDKPHTFYVASASGGVWKTENEGTTWQPIFDDAPSGSVGAISVDPSNTDTVWVGFGEANIFRSSMSGTGVYRSDDGGKTWSHKGLADSQHIARIVVHPQNSKIVYVAASGHEYTPNKQRGVFKTTDGGNTWKKVLYEDEMTGAIDLIINPKDPNVLYASMWHRIRRPWSDPLPGPGGGIYKSTDGGDTWKLITNGLPKRGKAGRMGIALAASKPNVVYVLVDNHEIARKARPGELDSYGRPRKDVLKGAQVFRSNDAGKTWTKTSTDGRTMTRLFSTYGWVFGQIRVDPNDENTTYIMGVPLLRSTDGGKKYEQLYYRGLHGDHHAMWINPKNSKHIINGNDGGVNISYDGGKTWKDIDNLPLVQFYNVAVDNARPFNVYGSIQDNNSWVGPSNHRPGVHPKTAWKRTAGGEASYHAVDPDNPNILYSESFYGRIQRTDLSKGRRGTKSIVPRARRGAPPLRGQWLAPFIISPHDSKTIYHGMQYVFKSTNRGDSWTRISDDLSYNDPKKRGNISFQTISSLSESPIKAGLLYAGTDDGRVHVTKDDGKSWKEILNGLPPKTWVSRVVASKYDEGTVYLTKNGKRDNDFQVYVYRSRDYGETWTDISKGIPGGPVNVIKEDPKNKNVLYVGTDLGVYVSTDGAKTWNVLGTGLPITFVHDLVIHTRDGVAVIATHGRGMFTLNVRSFQK